MAHSGHDRVQTQIIDELRRRGLLVTATANGAAMSPTERVRQARCGLSRGVPDILCFGPIPGHLGFAIEVKTGQGYATPEQQRWLDRLRDIGWLTMIAGSVEEVVKVLDERLADR